MTTPCLFYPREMWSIRKYKIDPFDLVLNIRCSATATWSNSKDYGDESQRSSKIAAKKIQSERAHADLMPDVQKDFVEKAIPMFLKVHAA